MKLWTGIALGLGAFAAVALAVGVPDWHRPIPGRQIGADGTAMEQFDSPNPWQIAPAPQSAEPPAAPGGAAATTTYTNLSVMTDIGADEFMRSHRAMMAWVSPKDGCDFCHSGTNYAADDNPMKAETRRMIQLTRTINATWRGHVGETGVTCFTCHRGEPVPPATWTPHPPRRQSMVFEADENWNENAQSVYGFFPDNGWSLYFLQNDPIRVEAHGADRTEPAPPFAAKRVYEFMMQMSDDLGVNCTYCHNSRDFADWKQSPPNRRAAYDAIRMTRDLDIHFMLPLADAQRQTVEPDKQNALVAPPGNHAPAHATGFIVCATCHYGRTVPDDGAATIANYPAFATAVNANPSTPAGAPPPSGQ